MKYISGFFTVLFNWNYWLMNHRFSKQWDREINSMIDSGLKFTNITRYTAQLGARTLWISNHPYASFTTYSSGEFIFDELKKVRPSRFTIIKARKHLEKSFMNSKVGLRK